jgi:hypothetical protein
MSEMELTILRQRAHEALKQKARRGELFTSVAIGYVRSRHDRIEKDPDLRVREALALVFRKFAELQSVRQVHLWFRQERILLPAVCYGAEPAAGVEAAGLQHDPSHPQKPDLCRRLRVRPVDQQDENREWPKARQARSSGRAAGMGRFDPRPP